MRYHSGFLKVEFIPIDGTWQRHDGVMAGKMLTERYADFIAGDQQKPLWQCHRTSNQNGTATSKHQ